MIPYEANKLIRQAYDNTTEVLATTRMLTSRQVAALPKETLINRSLQLKLLVLALENESKRVDEILLRTYGISTIQPGLWTEPMIQSLIDQAHKRNDMHDITMNKPQRCLLTDQLCGDYCCSCKIYKEYFDDT